MTIEVKFEDSYDYDKIVTFYKNEDNFPLMGETINEWLTDKNNNTICLTLNKTLIGAVTFKNMTINNVKFLYIYLICVDVKFRSKNYGNKIIEYLKINNNKILVWVDSSATGFFFKHNFIPDQKLGDDLQYYGIRYNNNSVFHHFGLSYNDVMELRCQKKMILFKQFGLKIPDNKTITKRHVYAIIISKEVGFKLFIEYICNMKIKNDINIEFSNNYEGYYLVKFESKKKKKNYI